MYFDAVLSKNMKPLFNGSPEDTKQWLKDNETRSSDLVCKGDTLELMTVEEYLERAKTL